MIGGGFLGQMHDTLKKNRDLVRASLGKAKRKAFDNGDYPSSEGKKILDDGKKLSDLERQELIAKIQKENRRETRKKIVILVIAVSILVGVYLGLSLFIE